MNLKRKLKVIIGNFNLIAFLAVVLLIIILNLKTILFYNNVGIDTNKALISTFSFIFIMAFPLFFIKKEKNRISLFIIIDLIVSLLLLANNIYYKYSSTFLSVNQIGYLKYGKEISSALPYLLNISLIFYVIDIPIIFLLWHFARRLY